MAKTATVHGHSALTQTLSEHADNKEIYVVFYADPDENSISWCPDCVVADPVLKKHTAKLSSDAAVITCYVGDRPQWKSADNVFRTDPKYKLTSVPTVIQIGSPKRLVEDQCAKDDLVDMFFFED